MFGCSLTAGCLLCVQPVPVDKPVHVKREGPGFSGKTLQRTKKKPPKGMYLSQGDVAAMSCSAPAAKGVIRQLDTELITIKRQVGLNISTKMF